MRITDVKSYSVKVGHRNCFVVKIWTDEGVDGVGEGGMSGRERAMAGMLDHERRLLLGEDPRRIEHLWQKLYRGWYFEGGKINGAVLSAIDLALHDLVAKWLGVPVYQLLGGACRDRVETFRSCGPAAAAGAVDEASAAVAAGWRVLRFMPGGSWSWVDERVFDPLGTVEETAQGLRAIRDAVGPEIQLALDYHHRLNVAEAAVLCRKLEDLAVQLLFLEEPIRAENPDAYRQLRTMTSIPFAVGEEFASKWEFRPYLEQGLLNFARVDVANVGGLTEAKKVAGWAEVHYIDLLLHNPLGPITTAASIQLGAAVNNFAQLEFQGALADQFPTDLFPLMPHREGAAYPVPTTPGLGVTFDETRAADHPFEFWEPPQLRRPDGAHTNW